MLPGSLPTVPRGDYGICSACAAIKHVNPVTGLVRAHNKPYVYLRPDALGFRCDGSSRAPAAVDLSQNDQES